MQETKISSFVKNACKPMNDAAYKERTAYYHDRKRPELSAFVQYLYAAAERYSQADQARDLRDAGF